MIYCYDKQNCMERAELSDTQKAVYDFIVDYLRKNKYPPTMGDIKIHFNYGSTNTVVTHLKKLEKKGYIKKPDGVMRVRTIQLVDDVIGNYTVSSMQFAAAMTLLASNSVVASEEQMIAFLKSLGVDVVR